MEAAGVNLTDDEVRERFSAFHDGELPEPEAASVRRRLAEDATLAREYEAFTAMIKGLAGLGLDAGGEMQPGAAPADVARVDLLGGVQTKLHVRSRGRFYGNRFTRASGIAPVEIAAVVLLVLLAAAYVCMTYVSDLSPAAPHGAVR